MCIHCGDIHHVSLSWEEGHFFLSDKQRQKLPTTIDIDKVIDAVIKNVHEGEKNTPGQDRVIIKEQYGKLREAVKEGYGKLGMEVEYPSPNFNMLKNLQTNVGVFSAFKKHDMMKELVKGLKDDKGNLKSYHDFRKEALPLVGKYREDWLQTEYNTAVRSSRMAANWERYQETKHLYPNLKYTVSRSAIKREDHLELVGTILPIDHAWWKIHYPPNGYNCLCSATPTDEHPTELPPAVEINPAFAFNSGAEGKVFDTRNHPYAKLPQKEYQNALKAGHGALCKVEAKEFIATKGAELRKKKITVPGLDKPVQFNRESFTHSLQISDYFLDRLNVLNDIEEHLKNAYPPGEPEPNRDTARKPSALQYHKLKVSGKNISLVLEERVTGQLYLYMIKLADLSSK